MIYWEREIIWWYLCSRGREHRLTAYGASYKCTHLAIIHIINSHVVVEHYSIEICHRIFETCRFWSCVLLDFFPPTIFHGLWYLEVLLTKCLLTSNYTCYVPNVCRYFPQWVASVTTNLCFPVLAFFFTCSLFNFVSVSFLCFISI